MRTVDIDYLKTRLNLDAETGVLTWRSRPREHFKSVRGWKSWNTKHIGHMAGCVSNGRRVVNVDGRMLLASRLIYSIHYGRWPEAFVDHIDGDKLNDAPGNLREATGSENGQNRGKTSTNTSGFKGVIRTRNRWRAQICCRGRRHYLGEFIDPAEAHAAYVEAATRLHGEFARTE